MAGMIVARFGRGSQKVLLDIRIGTRTILILEIILHIFYSSSLKLGVLPTPPGRLDAPEFILKWLSMI